MPFESYRQIAELREDITLRRGDSAKFDFYVDDTENKRFRLFFTGETALFYFRKSEVECTSVYHCIEDALDGKNAFKAPYCLDFSCKKTLDYPKVAFKKVVFPPVLAYLALHGFSDSWSAGIFAKAENLEIKNGYIRITYEVRNKRDGIPNEYTGYAPDRVFTLDILAGTYGWRELNINIDLKNAASVVCYIEAIGYSGKLLFERPYITSSNGYNILPDFMPPQLGHDGSSWLGHNLSRKEWPEFEIRLNGNAVFNGEMFERCHRYSECECDIPENAIKAGKNTLEIKLISDYPNPLPYSIREVGLFERPNHEFDIAACPRVARTNSAVPILIKTKYRNEKITLECKSGVLENKSVVFENAGLNVFETYAHSPANNVQFILKTETHTARGTIDRIAVKDEDNVFTGTADFVYINQENMSDVEEYLTWYISNGLGSLFTVRQTYRWSGARVLNSGTWAVLNNVLNKLNMKYVHMVDGREFPGLSANPTVEMLAGKGFMGRQANEFDSYVYGWHTRVQALGSSTSDYFMKICRENPETSNLRNSQVNFVVNKQTGEIFYDVDFEHIPDDMEEAAEVYIENLKKSKNNLTRHTGPTVTFRNFYQAGYDWTGAELMYGPLEIIAAFLRGAAYCYNKKSTGAHLAIQWSTTPHDTPERFRRYGTALRASYMQGITDINTEEGLWHLEEYYSHFHRESEACRGHKAQQQKFADFIASHSRTGEFYTPFAFVFGRFDGFRSFGKNSVWGNPRFYNDAPELSWELLDMFYPLEKANGELYVHPCPVDREIGMLSGTPRGNVDVIPIECSAKQMKKYRALAFLGYNKAVRDDFDKIEEFVEQGGTLIIGLPHMSVTSRRCDVVNLNSEYIKHGFAENFAYGFTFAEDTYYGNTVHVNKNVNPDGEVLAVTDGNLPLLIKYRLGNGMVYFVNAKEYPYSIQAPYRMAVEEVSNTLNESENAFIKCDERIQFAVYLQKDNSKHIYVTAVDWYHDPAENRTAELIFNKKAYPVKIPFGVTEKIVVNDNIVAWTDTETSEVLCADKNGITVQGCGETMLYYVSDGVMKEEKIRFGQNGKIVTGSSEKEEV